MPIGLKAALDAVLALGMAALGLACGFPDLSAVAAPSPSERAAGAALLLSDAARDGGAAPTPAGPADRVDGANEIRSIRTVPVAPALDSTPGVEIELFSTRLFPVRNELAVLRIGAQEFALSRYPDDGDLHTLIFTLSLDEYASLATGDTVTVGYGRGLPAGPRAEAGEGDQWDFGTLDKERLDGGLSG